MYKNDFCLPLELQVSVQKHFCSQEPKMSNYGAIKAPSQCCFVVKLVMKIHSWKNCEFYHESKNKKSEKTLKYCLKSWFIYFISGNSSFVLFWTYFWACLAVHRSKWFEGFRRMKTCGNGFLFAHSTGHFTPLHYLKWPWPHLLLKCNWPLSFRQVRNLVPCCPSLSSAW